MTSDKARANEQIVRRWIELTNARDFEGLREVWADDLVLHQGEDLEDLRGFDSFLELLTPFYDALPDLKIVIEDIVADDTAVIMRSRSSGTHTGELMGIPASGNRVEFIGISTYRIADGKIAEEWFNDDLVSLMKQVGAAH